MTICEPTQTFPDTDTDTFKDWFNLPFIRLLFASVYAWLAMSCENDDPPENKCVLIARDNNNYERDFEALVKYRGQILDLTIWKRHLCDWQHKTTRLIRTVPVVKNTPVFTYIACLPIKTLCPHEMFKVEQKISP